MFVGKIVGALIGFRFGFLPGALIGLIVGHLFDSWLARSRWRGFAAVNPWARRQALFTDCVIALSAKLAKVDGPVSRAEIDAFKSEFRIASGQLRAVGQAFDRAKQTASGYEAYAKKLGTSFRDAPILLAGVLDALRRIALSDGPLQPTEKEFLSRVAGFFGLTGARAEPDAAGAGDDPYSVLGVSNTASMDEIKAAWRELVRQHHPDTLIAKGLPKDYVELATRKMAAINAAYDRIRKERGDV